MKAYHLKQVVQLEELIKQPQKSSDNYEIKSNRHRAFLNWRNQDKSLSKVIEVNNEIIAFYHLLLDPTLVQSFYFNEFLVNIRHSYLAQISIKQNFQNQGVGKFLLEDIYKESTLHNKEKVILEVNSNTKAFIFYKNQNFKELESQVFMSKNLI
ncbi:MAG: hypothetical protein COB02_01565 [Candidatus Cloacimonadota bacterium]|nr:MAG: hypothetical protein COB02_01565 [Candidatus Cloacimonadota bacterium]